MALDKKTALVVGGSGELGQAIWQTLAQDGYSTFGTFRSGHDKSQSICDTINNTGGNASCGQMDLLDAQSVEQALEMAERTIGPLTSIVFATGPSIAQKHVASITEEEFQSAVNSDVMGFFRLIKAGVPRLRANGGGSIVAVSSFAVHSYPPQDILGAAPKASVEMLCRGLSKEEGRNGIRANCVAPGIIEAGMGKKFMDELFSAEVWDAQRKNIPLRRFGSAQDIAEAALYLASPRSSYVTGQTIIVDGGFGL